VTRRIGLALTLHNHQPVGNFGWVIAENYERAYLPMLEALERHPGVRLALHYTGPLMDWLRLERPEFLDRVAGLAKRGQVEIVGGGWYEPVLAALPERDRVAQLTRMADELERRFGRRPQGAWLAERVWEPDLPTSLVEAGYRWTILDDAHFRAAAIPEEALWGPYTTDDQGKRLTVYGTEQGLRFHIPFSPVDVVIEHLRDHATESGDRVGTMGDDGEKFGAWPTTYEQCWEKRWVDRFFDALEANRDWLTTWTPSAWLDEHPPIGRVYLPTGSYAEMGEWALPPDESRLFSKVLKRARDEGRPEVRWLRGAIWRNFQARYREVNDLHKQMLRTSDLVDLMPAGAARERALDNLLAGQSNDPYWHGLFGGIYLPDLRVANLAHLIAAEDLAYGGRTPESGVLRDLDLDGRAEALLANDAEIVGVKLDEGAGIGRWDLRAPRVPLAAVLRRRPEAYHETVRELDARLAASASDSGASGAIASGSGRTPDADDSAVKSPHELAKVKQAGLSNWLRYDATERRSGLVRFIDPDVGFAAWDTDAGADRGDFASGAWDCEELIADRLVVSHDGHVTIGGTAHPARARATIAIGGGRLDPTLIHLVEVTNTGSSPFTARIGTEWSVMLLGGGANPAAYLELEGRRVPHDSRVSAEDAAGFGSGNEFLGVAVTTSVAPAADVWIAPIQTVSNSEGGYELVYQGSTALVGRVVTLEPGESATIEVAHLAAVAVDRALEEAATPA
jgi:4-alpha-glucanotransferase